MMTLASAFNRPHVVNILCQIKGKPEIENAKGWSSVHISAAYNHISVLDIFLALGVSINEPESHRGYTALHLAAAMDKSEVLERLHLSKQADFTKKACNVRSLSMSVVL